MRGEHSLPADATRRLIRKDEMEPSDIQLLRPADVACRLGVSRSWLYEAAKTGRIPCVRLGGDNGPVRFRPDELQRWLREGSRPRAAREADGPSDAALRSRRKHAKSSTDQLSWPLLAPVDAAR